MKIKWEEKDGVWWITVSKQLGPHVFSVRRHVQTVNAKPTPTFCAMYERDGVDELRHNMIRSGIPERLVVV